jgi:hypothetical protein
MLLVVTTYALDHEDVDEPHKCIQTNKLCFHLKLIAVGIGIGKFYRPDL